VVWEQNRNSAGDATRRGDDPAGGYAGVPTVFLQHTRVSSGGLAREQENPKVHGGVGIANQSSSIVLLDGPRHPATPIPRWSSEQDHDTSRKLVTPLIEPLFLRWNIVAVAKPTIVATGHHEKYPSSHSSPTTIPWQASSSPTEPRHHRALLIDNPVHRGNLLSAHSSSLPRLPQGLPWFTKSS
jgi:hypothetical protein